MLTMDPKSWRLYAIPLSVCSVVLDFPPLLLGCATTAPILKLLWRSCLSLFFRTHKPYYWAFPEPIQIAVVDEGELLKLIRNERRTEYLITIARAFSEVDEEFLKTAPDEEVEVWLRNIKSIGEWSATFIMVRGLGRMEHVPLTETRLIEATSKVYGYSEELSRDDLKRLADRYGPWQGYWAHYLRVGT